MPLRTLALVFATIPWTPAAPLQASRVAPAAFQQDDAEGSDPSAVAVQRAQQAMKRDATLADLRWEWASRGDTPVLFERDADGPPNTGRVTLERILERWLVVQRRELIEARWLPEEQRELARAQRVPVFVLTEPGQYELAEPTFTRCSPEAHAAFYEPELGAVVARSQEFENISPAEHRRSVLRTAAWAQLEALLTPRDAAAEATDDRIPSWLWQGLSCTLSNGQGADPESLADPRLNSLDMKFLEIVLDDHEVYLHACPRPHELIALRGRQGIYDYPKRYLEFRRGQLGHMLYSWVLSFSAETWVHFLLTRRAEGPAQMQTYLGAVLDGTDSPLTFAEVFGFETPRDAEREYLQWLGKLLKDEYRHQVPRMPRILKEIPESTWSRASNLVEAAAEAPVVLTVADRLALAFALAREGLLEEACDDLMAASEAESERAARERLKRVVEQLRELNAARRSLVRAAVRDRKYLRLTREGEEYRARPEEFEDGVIRFRPSNKYPFEELAIEDLGTRDLAENLRKRSDRYGEPWTEALARFISSDEDWERALPDDASSERIAADWEGVEVTDWLESLVFLAGQSSPPRQLDDFRDWLDGRVAELRQVRFPDRHRDALSARLRAQLVQTLERATLEDLCAGKLEDLGDGRYRVTQNFLSEEQLGDFRDDDRWFDDVRRQSDLQLPLGRRRFLSEGHLVVTGRRSLAHNFEFGPPLRLETEVELTSADGPVIFYLCVCGIDPHQFIRISNTVHLDVGVRKRGFYERATLEDTSIRSKTPYRMELTYEDETVRFERQGDEPVELSVPPMDAGQLLLWTHCQHWVKLKYLVIEGTITEEGLERTRRNVLEAELEHYGL